MSASQVLAEIASVGPVVVKTVRYNGVEFKAGTARAQVSPFTDMDKLVVILGQSHQGHEILVKTVGRFQSFREQEKLQSRANKMVALLNS